MKKHVIVLLSLLACFVCTHTESRAASVAGSLEGLSEIRAVYSEFYRMKPALVADLERKKLPDDDISVLLFLSRKSAVSTSIILQWRLSGMSWLVITRKLRLEPTVYYTPLPAHHRPGPPYGKAYGYYRKHPRGKVRNTAKDAAVVFDDVSIRSLVQLRLVSQYYGYPPEVIMQRHSAGEKYDTMIRTEYRKKHKKNEQKKAKKKMKGNDKKKKKKKKYD